MTDQVVHILYVGQALCGLDGPPCSWPEGHVWVSLGRPEANCAECIEHSTLSADERMRRAQKAQEAAGPADPPSSGAYFIFDQLQRPSEIPPPEPPPVIMAPSLARAMGIEIVCDTRDCGNEDCPVCPERWDRA